MGNKVFVVPYFGALPNYFQLWLNSCSLNKEFTWLLITDCATEGLIIPSNVITEKSSLRDVCDVFSNELQTEIFLEGPYKLCDFRPLYWMLLDYYKVDYSFWGYCDIDLLFGRLEHFFNKNIFHTYDKVGSFGHLTLIKATDKCKKAYQLDGAKYSWKTILSNKKVFGFDERYGLNRIWKKHGFTAYNTRDFILDILPDFENFHLASVPQNRKGQIFIYHQGKVLQIYKSRDRLVEKEFAYIHFQKRKLNLNFSSPNQLTFLINEDGFSESTGYLNYNQNGIESISSKAENLKNKMRKLRGAFRYYKMRILKEF